MFQSILAILFILKLFKRSKFYAPKLSEVIFYYKQPKKHQKNYKKLNRDQSKIFKIFAVE